MTTPTPPTPTPLKVRPPRRMLAFSLCLVLGIGAAFIVQWRRDPQSLGVALSGFSAARDFPQSLPARPLGMAPQAFSAFLRACIQSNVSPFRIGQTIGDDPRSVGYHKRDGTLWVNGQKIDYCAAVDLGTSDLSDAQIARFQNSLAREGFASFYRHGGKWRGGEHIHAIYGSLKMKSQLEEQTRDWLRERRRKNLTKLGWEKRFRALN